MSMLHSRWSILLASFPHLQILHLAVFPHLHPFLHFLGPFNNFNKRCSSFTKAAISLFHHQDSLCLLIPRVSQQTSITSSVRHSLKFFQTSDIRRLLHHQCSSGLHLLFQNTCSYIISQLLNFASFHKFHLTLIQPYL